MAQLGGLVMLDPSNQEAKEQFFFGGIEGCRFRKPVVPGDTLVSGAPQQWQTSAMMMPAPATAVAVLAQQQHYQQQQQQMGSRSSSSNSCCRHPPIAQPMKSNCILQQ